MKQRIPETLFILCSILLAIAAGLAAWIAWARSQSVTLWEVEPRPPVPPPVPEVDAGPRDDLKMRVFCVEKPNCIRPFSVTVYIQGFKPGETVTLVLPEGLVLA